MNPDTNHLFHPEQPQELAEAADLVVLHVEIEGRGKGNRISRSVERSGNARLSDHPVQGKPPVQAHPHRIIVPVHDPGAVEVKADGREPIRFQRLVHVPVPATVPSDQAGCGCFHPATSLREEPSADPSMDGRCRASEPPGGGPGIKRERSAENQEGRKGILRSPIRSGLIGPPSSDDREQHQENHSVTPRSRPYRRTFCWSVDRAMPSRCAAWRLFPPV